MVGSISLFLIITKLNYEKLSFVLLPVTRWIPQRFINSSFWKGCISLLSQLTPFHSWCSLDCNGFAQNWKKRRVFLELAPRSKESWTELVPYWWKRSFSEVWKDSGAVQKSNLWPSLKCWSGVQFNSTMMCSTLCGSSLLSVPHAEQHDWSEFILLVW